MKMFALLFAFGMGVAVSAHAETYQIVQSTQTTIATPDGDLIKTDTIIQVGDNPLNRFTMHRVVKNTAVSDLRGSLLLLPGEGTNFSFYEIDENDDYANSIIAYFARRNIDVYGYSPRSKQFASGECANLLGNVCAEAMKDWGFQTVVDDAEFIRTQIQLVHGARKPVIGGMSLGAMTTIAALNSNPTGYAGAVIWEGMLYSADPLVTSGNAVNCADRESQLALGQYVQTGLVETLKTLPRDALLTATTTPQSCPPAAVPGYTFFAGSALGYTYASETRVNKSFPTFNPYDPTRISRDYTCALAGERTFTDNLMSFTAPLYVIGGGRAFGAWMGDNLALFGTPSSGVTRNYQPDFGHGDAFASANHVQYVEAPVYEWLTSVVYP